MIICSCNVFSDADVKMAIADATAHPRLSCVYALLGCAARCGRCARTIKALIDDATGRSGQGVARGEQGRCFA
jgi:bacterioferritin-associated ferredoxin